jgi:hypothetical protein
MTVAEMFGAKRRFWGGGEGNFKVIFAILSSFSIEYTQTLEVLMMY